MAARASSARGKLWAFPRGRVELNTKYFDSCIPGSQSVCHGLPPRQPSTRRSRPRQACEPSSVCRETLLTIRHGLERWIRPLMMTNSRCKPWHTS